MPPVCTYALALQELEAECARSKAHQLSAQQREKEALQLECETQGVLLKAELDACELKVQGGP